jgi:DNA-binding NtrC family response regulator
MEEKMSTRACKILLVDDDKGILGFLHRFLLANKYQIFTTHDPLSAIAMIAKENIDILISDVSMPGISGIDLAAIVRREFPHVVRILMTGTGSVETVIRAINEGEIFRYLSKPFDNDLLLATLQEATARAWELQAVRIASTEKAAATRLKRDLTHDYPGIEQVTRRSGVYIVDTKNLQDKKELLPKELQRLLH